MPLFMYMLRLLAHMPAILCCSTARWHTYLSFYAAALPAGTHIRHSICAAALLVARRLQQNLSADSVAKVNLQPFPDRDAFARPHFPERMIRIQRLPGLAGHIFNAEQSFF